MTQAYRDALLEYLAMSELVDDLRINLNSETDLRDEAYSRKCDAREKLIKSMGGRRKN